ncbi:MAG: sialidase family protein [Legionellaceae bacterium]|nr:sialidase family protein [Legionellaceae bacterium]
MTIIKKYTLITGLISTLLSCVAFSMNTTVDSIQIKTHFNNFNAISCDSTAQRCLAVSVIRNSNGNEKDYAVRGTQDGGNTWDSPVILQRFLKTVDDRDEMKIHCDNSGLACLIAVSMHNPENLWPERAHVIVYTTYDAGIHWSEPKLIPGVLVNMVGLSCGQSGDNCLLLGQYNNMATPHVYMTQNAGLTWSGPLRLPKSNNSDEAYDSVLGMSCSDSGLVCAVVGGSMHPTTYITKDGGYTWLGPNLLKDEINEIAGNVGEDFFSNLHCNSSGLSCIALRHQYIYQDRGVMVTAVYSYTTLDGGIHWKKTGAIDNLDGEIYEPFSVFDCDKEGLKCVAIHSPVGDEGSRPLAYATYDGGQTWSKKVLEIPEESTTTILLDIYCDDNAVLCQAVGMQDPYHLKTFALRKHRLNDTK